MVLETEESVAEKSESISSVCRLNRVIVGEVNRLEDTFLLKRSSACSRGGEGVEVGCAAAKEAGAAPVSGSG